jgi:hypothetical protein
MTKKHLRPDTNSKAPRYGTWCSGQLAPPLPPGSRRPAACGSLMRDGGVIFSPSSWEPQEEGMMNIAARFFPQLRNQGMSVRRGRSQTTEGDAC